MKSFLSATVIGSAVYSHAVLFFTLLLFSGTANSALAVRYLDGDTSNPHVAVYDDVLDITWLADANLALTNTFGISGINSQGGMSFDTAQAYIAAMNADNGGDGYLGVNTWRQPETEPQNGVEFNLGFTFDGSSDRGYNIGAPFDPSYNIHAQSEGFTGAEFGHHYYVNFGGIAAASGPGLGGAGFEDVTFFAPSEFGFDDARNTENLALFSNIFNGTYWIGTLPPSATGNQAFFYGGHSGNQVTTARSAANRVWAVAPGDVFAAAVAVPIPGVGLWLFGAMLMGVVARCRAV